MVCNGNTGRSCEVTCNVYSECPCEVTYNDYNGCPCEVTYKNPQWETMCKWFVMIIVVVPAKLPLIITMDVPVK